MLIPLSFESSRDREIERERERKIFYFLRLREGRVFCRGQFVGSLNVAFLRTDRGIIVFRRWVLYLFFRVGAYIMSAELIFLFVDRPGRLYWP